MRKNGISFNDVLLLLCINYCLSEESGKRTENVSSKSGEKRKLGGLNDDDESSRRLQRPRVEGGEIDEMKMLRRRQVSKMGHFFFTRFFKRQIRFLRQLEMS